MPNGSQYGQPRIVEGLNEGDTSRALVRVHLEKGQKGQKYDERWLQRLIMRHPNLLPIDEIEPGLVPAIPVCVEVPTPSGFLDNLLVTPDGDLILVECKLWRNPEARREVVGQIIDYAKDIAAWSYEDLEAAIRRAPRPPEQGGRLERLLDAVSPSFEIDEARFVDAVSRNLRLGRFLLLIVGDGIQEGVEGIARFLQQHAGLHFTLAIVELAIFELPAGGFLIQPRILTRTVNIERGIVTIQDDKVAIKAPQTLVSAGTPSGQKTTITEEKFFETLASVGPSLPSRLKSFLASLVPLGVVIEPRTSSLVLRWYDQDGQPWSLGAINSDGKVWTEYVNSRANAIGRLDLSHGYLIRIASGVSGTYVKETPKQTSWRVDADGTYVTIGRLLDHQTEWRAAIEEFTTAIKRALEDKS